jgi:hypothetical protein
MLNTNQTEIVVTQTTFRNVNLNGPDVTTIEMNFKNEETYRGLTLKFLHFLQHCGFTYVGGLTVHDQDGNVIFTTN